MRSAMVAYGVVVMATGLVRKIAFAAIECRLLVDGGVDTSINHRFVAGDRRPRSTTRSLRLMVMVVASKAAVQPVSHSCPIDRRAPAGKFVKICPRRASTGSAGRSRRHVCVEVTVLPSGMVTVIGSVAIWRLVCGVSIDI